MGKRLYLISSKSNILKKRKTSKKNKNKKTLKQEFYKKIHALNLGKFKAFLLEKI